MEGRFIPRDPRPSANGESSSRGIHRLASPCVARLGVCPCARSANQSQVLRSWEALDCLASDRSCHKKIIQQEAHDSVLITGMGRGSHWDWGFLGFWQWVDLIVLVSLPPAPQIDIRDCGHHLWAVMPYGWGCKPVSFRWPRMGRIQVLENTVELSCQYWKCLPLDY